MLSSQNFASMIKEVRQIYDYVVIDSAPCLLVADTHRIIQLIDSAVFVVRSNYTDKKICDFINEFKENNKIDNLNIVLNSVGHSQAYGYRYNYQYGYNYSYNYGYGYGYSEDKS